MRRVAILVAAIAFTISINANVFATGVESPNSENNEININRIVNNNTGIMPDSIFYCVDKALDNLKLFLTIDDAKKTEIILQIANERLVEYDSMTVKEKYDLAKDMIKELEKLNDKSDSNTQETIETQLVKREAIANMVKKRQQLNAARQEYQLVKTILEQANTSGDEVAIKVAEELLKEKQSLYKAAKEEYEIALKEMKKVINELKKIDENAKIKEVENKEVENKEEDFNKVEEEKSVNLNSKVQEDTSVNVINKVDENKNIIVTNKVDEKLIKQNDSEKVIKVIYEKENVVKQEDKNILSNTKTEKVKKFKTRINHNIVKGNNRKVKVERNK